MSCEDLRVELEHLVSQELLREPFVKVDVVLSCLSGKTESVKMFAVVRLAINSFTDGNRPSQYGWFDNSIILKELYGISECCWHH